MADATAPSAVAFPPPCCLQANPTCHLLCWHDNPSCRFCCVKRQDTMEAACPRCGWHACDACFAKMDVAQAALARRQCLHCQLECHVSAAAAPPVPAASAAAAAAAAAVEEGLGFIVIE